MLASALRRLGPRASLAALLVALLAIACAGDSAPTVEANLPVVDELGRVPALRCPGDPTCAVGSGPLRVGVAARDITPTIEPFEDLDGNQRWDEGEPFDDLDGDGAFDPVWIAGFSSNRPALGVHDPLWVRALVFEQGDLRVGLVSLDVVGLFHGDVLAIRRAVRAAGLELDHLSVVTTHNHEGADTMGPWGPSPDVPGRDADYTAYFVAQTVAAVQAAWAAREDSRLTWAQVDLPDLVHDSRQPEVKDALLTGIRFEGAGGTHAVLTIWGNHPEALGGSNRDITSDYPHYLRTKIEAAYPGATAVFVAGNLGGLMNPLHVVGCPDADGNATCETGTFEKAAYIGEGAADAILEALDGPEAAKVEAPDLRLRRQPIYIPPDNLVFFAGWVAKIFDRTLFTPERVAVSRARAEATPLEDVQAGKLLLQTEVGALGLGPLELVTVPGELYPELWLTGPDGESLVEHPEGADFPDAPAEPALSTLVPDAYVPVVINQANDSLGYLIPKPQYDRSAPRAYRDNGQYGESNSVGPDGPMRIAEGVRALYE